MRPTSKIAAVTLKRVADRPTWLLSRANARAHRILRQAFEAEGVRGYHFRAVRPTSAATPESTAVTSLPRSTTSPAAGSLDVPPTPLIDAATS